ncbi:MAG: hypothetical protein KGH98_04425 [Candidatus Micrarchaeota archaeon]|nr:hypothetical protein [Candidatus Micrarchaeota archaeon]MDE1857291.1 hypothetical protein [Candidatus Micrarchaeota archaeon]
MPRRESKEMATAPVILLMLGGIFVLVAGILIIGFSVVGNNVVPSFTHTETSAAALAAFGVIGFIELVCGLMMIISAVVMNNGNPQKVTDWSVVALIFSGISIMGGGGFLVGFVFGIIGSILGISHRK